MAINYTGLKAEIAEFLNRDDLTSIIPTFISLAEAEFQRVIRHWKMEARVSGQQTAGWVPTSIARQMVSLKSDEISPEKDKDATGDAPSAVDDASPPEVCSVLSTAAHRS